MLWMFVRLVAWVRHTASHPPFHLHLILSLLNLFLLTYGDLLPSHPHKAINTISPLWKHFHDTFGFIFSKQNQKRFMHFSNLRPLLNYNWAIILSQFNLTGGEFRAFTKYFQTHGITHRLICPHTHHQNGTVERKHRHLTEVGLTLLAQASMTLRFWDDAVATATHIINRIPPSSLLSTSPFEVLFRKQPDYTAFKVFGCACYPFLCPYNKHKFEFRSSECTFLGYSPHHKGYKCLDPHGCVYISKDVVFHERRFPFQEHIPPSPSSPSYNIPSPLTVLQNPATFPTLSPSLSPSIPPFTPVSAPSLASVPTSVPPGSPLHSPSSHQTTPVSDQHTNVSPHHPTPSSLSSTPSTSYTFPSLYHPSSESSPVSLPSTPHCMLTRFKANSLTHQALLTYSEPATVSEALASP